MAFDLNAVRPRPDGKYSPELYRWLRREGRNRCGVFQRKIDPIFGEPTTAGVRRALPVCDDRGPAVGAG